MKIIIKILIAVVCVIIFGVIVNFLIKTYVLKDFKVNPNKDILVFGDSHSECNFYDIDNGVQNFGVRSEPPNLTLLKAQYLLSDNTKQSVIITLSPHNISAWREKRFYERDTTGAMLSKYWSLIDNSYLLEYYSTLPSKTRALLHLKKITGAPSVESSFLIKNRFKGGFYKEKDTTIINFKRAKKAYIRHFGDDYFNNTNNVFSSKKIKDYYREFISFAVSKGAQVFVVGTPIHSSYSDLLTSECKADYKTFLQELQVEFPSVKILNYTNLELEKSYFLDSDHLNFSGAKYFTDMVTKEIDK